MRIESLGLRTYTDVESAMRTFTRTRGPDTADQIWLVEHEPVFTQGVAGAANTCSMQA